jgi:hypothetical protein
LRWPHLKKGKESHWQFWSGHKLSLFFLGRFCILCCVKQKSVFFLGGNEYLGVQKLNLPPLPLACNLCPQLQPTYCNMRIIYVIVHTDRL